MAFGCLSGQFSSTSVFHFNESFAKRLFAHRPRFGKNLQAGRPSLTVVLDQADKFISLRSASIASGECGQHARGRDRYAHRAAKRECRFTLPSAISALESATSCRDAMLSHALDAGTILQILR